MLSQNVKELKVREGMTSGLHIQLQDVEECLNNISKEYKHLREKVRLLPINQVKWSIFYIDLTLL